MGHLEVHAHLKIRPGELEGFKAQAAELFEHNEHVMGARALLFEKYAFGHQMTAFGEVSERLRDLSTKHAGGITVYSFLQGPESAAAV